MLFNPAADVNLANGRVMTPSTGSKILNYDSGQVSSQSTQLIYGATDKEAVKNASEATFFAVGMMRNLSIDSGTDKAFIAPTSYGTGNLHRIGIVSYTGNATLALNFYYSGYNGNVTISVPSYFTAGKLFSLVGTFRKNNYATLYDPTGQLGQAAAGNFTLNNGELAVAMEFGYTTTNAGRCFDMFLGGLYSRCLPPDEAMELARNPWQLLQPRKTFVLISQGAGGHVVTGSGSSQADASSSGGIGQTHIVSGSVGTQAESSASGSVSQTHLVFGSSSVQAESAASGAVGQTHLVLALGSTQAESVSSGGIGQTHVVTASGSAQAGSVLSGFVTQTHLILGSTGVQAESASSGAVGQTHAVSAVGSSQSETSAGGSVIQVFIITGGSSTQSSTASSGAVYFGQGISGYSLTQAAVSGSGAVTQTHLLTTSVNVQVGLLSSSSVLQTYLLAGNSVGQISQSLQGAVTQTHKMSAGSVSQTAVCVSGGIVLPGNSKQYLFTLYPDVPSFNMKVTDKLGGLIIKTVR